MASAPAGLDRELTRSGRGEGVGVERGGPGQAEAGPGVPLGFGVGGGDLPEGGGDLAEPDPLHHRMVTPGRRTTCGASSWLMTSATRCSSGLGGLVGVDQEGDLVRKVIQPQVLHIAPKAGGRGRHQVDLVARIRDVVVVPEVDARIGDPERTG